jgi:hypothetical protein
MKEIVYFIDSIGLFGPFIMFFITIYYISNQTIYLWVFIIGSVCNHYINCILKEFIKQPRPTNQIDFMGEAENLFKRPQMYGMPSGHMQILCFSIAYLWSLYQTYTIYLVSFVIFIITFYQRWKYRRHTIEQLIWGSITGGVLGYYSYYFTWKYIHGF